MLDPDLIIVQFPAGGEPSSYRNWLDIANSQLPDGSAPAATSEPFTVRGVGAGNTEPVRILDPTLVSVNVLVVNSRPNADYVAGQLRILSDFTLRTCVLSAPEPLMYH